VLWLAEMLEEVSVLLLAPLLVVVLGEGLAKLLGVELELK